MSLPTSRPRLIKNNNLTVFINVNSTVATIKPGENTEWGVILFLSKIELTSLPSTGPKFSQDYLLLPFSYTHMISSRGTIQPTVKTTRVVQSKAKNNKQNFKQMYILNKIHSILHEDNYLSLISKYWHHSFKFSQNWTCLFIWFPFSFSFSFPLLFFHWHCHVNVFFFCFLLGHPWISK